MLLKFNSRGGEGDGALGYVTGFDTDADAAKFAEVAVAAGDKAARTESMNVVMMTSDPSLVVVNVTRRTFRQQGA